MVLAAGEYSTYGEVRKLWTYFLKGKRDCLGPIGGKRLNLDGRGPLQTAFLFPSQLYQTNSTAKKIFKGANNVFMYFYIWMEEAPAKPSFLIPKLRFIASDQFEEK